jgi:uncharacterized membrane protein SirB2
MAGGRWVVVALSFAILLAYIAFGVFALTDPNVKSHVGQFVGLWLAVPVVVVAVNAAISARSRV